jgi:hypothetical protein
MPVSMAYISKQIREKFLDDIQPEKEIAREPQTSNKCEK